MPHAFRLKDGLGLDDHLLRAGPQKEGAVTAYQRDRSGPLGSGLLELVGFPRIDDRLNKIKEYVKAKQENGGKDPFGPAGQPHFEIDFVVSIPKICPKCQQLTSGSPCSQTHSSGTSLSLRREAG